MYSKIWERFLLRFSASQVYMNDSLMFIKLKHILISATELELVDPSKSLHFKKSIEDFFTFILKFHFRVDFLANVGGLLGLCIGLSIVTVVELVWLSIRIFEKTSKKDDEDENELKKEKKANAWT